MKPHSLSVPGLALLLLAGCGDGMRDDQRTGTVTEEGMRRAREQLPEEVRVALDSGNVAYRRGEMDAALAHYRAAAEREPGTAAAWYGIYMVQRSRGDAAAAQEALRRADAAAPAASLLDEKRPR
jgi:tetratricopeptide (TPR) repeat protein